MNLILDAIKQTNGCAISISDETLLDELSTISSEDGVFVCSEEAAAFAAARKLRKDGWIKRRIMLLF